MASEREKRAALRQEMRDEIESTVAGPGPIGPFTKPMTKGLVRWVPVGTLIGAVVGLLLGLIPWGFDLSFALRLVLGAAIGAVAGATIGFVAGGFARTERAVEQGDHVEPQEGRTSGPPRTDAAGRPVGPSSEDAQRPVRGD